MLSTKSEEGGKSQNIGVLPNENTLSESKTLLQIQKLVSQGVQIKSYYIWWK